MILYTFPSTKTFTLSDLPDEWKNLGGRALIARMLLDKSDPRTDPLGAGNILIIAPGLLAGFHLSCMDRLSIGGKSPLTRGIKESNAGGQTAASIATLGLNAVILSGEPGKEWSVLYISEHGARFEKAAGMIGLGVYETAAILRNRYGRNCAAALIGPSGEKQYLASGIQNLDKDGIPSRISARGGLGAVMGSKKVKAIVFDVSKQKSLEPTDSQAFSSLRKKYNSSLLQNEFVKTLTRYGTAANTLIDNKIGALPTRNFSSGELSEAEKISGEAMFDQIVERKGNPSHGCMTGCVIRCSNIYPDQSGKPIVSPLEFETIGLLGSNLGIDDLDTIAKMNWELNDLGLDTIEVGAALGVAAEGRLWSFGDKRKAMELIDEIRRGTDIGCLLASGVSRTAEVLGVDHVPAVKRQAMPAYDPRVLKVTGITYATSAQGADHTAGMTLRSSVACQKNDELVALSKKLQIQNAGLDSIGACLFVGGVLKTSPGIIAELLRACYGRDFEDDILEYLGRNTLIWERKYNTQAGFTSTDNRIPKWMAENSVPPTGMVFDIPDQTLDNMFDELEKNYGEK
jgi:aldehyde:ferredoxin oxidoreductase